MICKPYMEQIPCSQACVSKILSHPTTSRLEEHIWLDALGLRRYTVWLQSQTDDSQKCGSDKKPLLEGRTQKSSITPPNS